MYPAACRMLTVPAALITVTIAAALVDFIFSWKMSLLSPLLQHVSFPSVPAVPLTLRYVPLESPQNRFNFQEVSL